MTKFGCWYVFVIFVVALCPAVTFGAAKCACRQHSAEAEGPTLCSRTENRRICEIAFSATPEHERRELLTRLEGMGLRVEPDRALEFVAQSPPKEWTLEDIRAKLPVLFAISQKRRFGDATEMVTSFIRRYADAIHRGISTPGNQVIQHDFAEASMTASYGCLEIGRESFFTMVKSQYSQRPFYCDD
jgi:hypothetical protein